MSSVPAARDSLRVIKYLATCLGPVRASSISRDLRLPRSTTYHLLRVMQDEGFVTHIPEDQVYGLSPLLMDLGTSLLTSNGIGTIARPLLQHMVAEVSVPAVAHLGILRHWDVVYVSKVSAQHAPRVITGLGIRLPAHLTATGRAMLSHLTISQVAAIYPSSESLVARHGSVSPVRLHSLLADARNHGWAVEDGEINPEYASVATALVDHNGYPAAAVGLTFRRTSISEENFEHLGLETKKAAESLSKRVRNMSASKTIDSSGTAPSR